MLCRRANSCESFSNYTSASQHKWIHYNKTQNKNIHIPWRINTLIACVGMTMRTHWATTLSSSQQRTFGFLFAPQQQCFFGSQLYTHTHIDIYMNINNAIILINNSTSINYLLRKCPRFDIVEWSSRSYQESTLNCRLWCFLLEWQRVSHLYTHPPTHTHNINTFTINYIESLLCFQESHSQINILNLFWGKATTIVLANFLN